MGFPCSLTTDEMALYVLGNFEWYRREVVFPPRPLPYDYEELCWDFELAIAKNAPKTSRSPSCPSNAIMLGVLRGWMMLVMESGLKELRWNAFQAWMGHNRAGSRRPVDRRHPVTRKRRRARGLTAKPPFIVMTTRGEDRLAMIVKASISSTEEMADHVRETFWWHLRSISCSSCPLPEDYQELCPRFALSEAEGAARDFSLPEMATFYATLLNDAVELGIASEFLAADLNASLEGLRWAPFASWMHHRTGGRVRPGYFSLAFKGLSAQTRSLEHHGLCPSFDLSEVTRYANDSNIPEMVQAIFYAMVLNVVAELGLACRLTMDCMMWKLDWAPIESWLGDIERRLRKAQASRLANPPAGPAPSGGFVEDSSLSDAPPASSHEEGDVPQALASPQITGHHLQFPSLLAFIDGRVVAHIPPNNQFREPKNIPHAVPIFKPDTPSWSSYEYSFIPGILSTEEEISYPSEITIADFMNDIQARRMAKTKSTPRVKTPDKLLAEGTIECNFCSASSSQRPRAEVLSTSSSSSSTGTSASLSLYRMSTSSSSDGPSISSSSDGTSVNSSSQGAPNASGRAVLGNRGHTPAEPVLEVVAKGLVFLGAAPCLDPLDGPSTHFSNLKVTLSLKRTALETKYLLPPGYSFVIPEADVTVNEPPQKCIAIYQVAFNYGVRFPLHPVIVEILNKFELAHVQIVPTSWHNICSFIATCDLRGLACTT
ncbi:LOW QUALITY PROTEIN: hypothetical protein Cgig2_008421 [Carnegiea gigantea]|uniref:Uncharacterized protein n=1 Tax=Carnegiea gigantea TaxID=171969 RepID=A0A9Q1K2C6_9CARY|nr:LOW QUALITY PROTEIN: hypothetical protein Cgig2_008421 [Carnegiea gigantea]